MEKDPLLYIDSAKNIDYKNPNQKNYDSRNSKPKKKFDETLTRLERYKSSGRLIICEFKTKNEIIEGELIRYKDNNFLIYTGNEEKIININDLEDLTILKV